MTDALVKQGPAQLAALFPRSVDESLRFSEMLAKSELVPKEFRGRAADIFLVINFGMELGLPPIAALRGMMCINGRPAPYAATLVGIVQAAPSCKFFRCVSSDDKEATYETWRVGYPEPQRETFTMTDAVRAGLADRNQNYKLYPRKMLEARASAALARKVYADICAGVYVAEEVVDFDDSPMAPPAGKVIEAKFHDPAKAPTPAEPTDIDDHPVAKMSKCTTKAQYMVFAPVWKAMVGAERDLAKLVHEAHKPHLDTPHAEECLCHDLARTGLVHIFGPPAVAE